MRCLIIGIAAVAAFAGCSGGGDDGKHEITGTATWNDTPIEDGKITLVSPEGVMDAGDISDGTFQLRTAPGEKTVMVTAEKSAGMADPGGGEQPGRMEPEPVMYQYIPKEHNLDSQLKKTIAEDTTEVTIELSGDEIPPPEL